MSEQQSNTFPFPGMESGGDLDLNVIFGAETAGSDKNPFDMPAAKGPLEQPAPAAETAAAQKQSEPEPAAKETSQQESDTPPEAVNPIAAAFEQKEDENTKRGLLEKSPVFAYGSARESIKDAGMTFEELRIAKADDFPELSEGKKVSWTVEYGKTVKTISDPKGTTIKAVKTEIELSKAFLDGLKKAKDKNPDCLVKPRVIAQSKGTAAYKGVFLSLEEARASDKAICLIPAGDGRVYELRKSELGEFVAPKDNVVEFPQIRAGFTPALPLIPMSLLSQIIAFFRCYMNRAGGI